MARAIHRTHGFGAPSVWRRALLVLLVWALFGLLYANVIYLSMMGHGHAWSRLVLWQLVNWVGWAALTPVVVALGRRFPLEPRWRRAPRFAFHAAAAIAVSLVHLVPLAWATSTLDPYAPVVTVDSFAEAYRRSLGSWFRLDVVIYWAILAVWTAWTAFVRARERERRAVELESLLARRELEVLRLQLHPHFLFNTLHAAISLVRSGAADEASRVLTGLSDLLRRLLDPDLGQEVALGTELRFLGRYLEIEQIRHPELRVEMEIEPAARQVVVPSLILQPLVENAIEHGTQEDDGERWVLVRAELRDGRLVLGIENPADDAQRVERSGIGLSNTRRRLRELYGADGSLRLIRTDGGVMHAVLEIPARREGAGDGRGWAGTGVER